VHELLLLRLDEQDLELSSPWEQRVGILIAGNGVAKAMDSLGDKRKMGWVSRTEL
jgi:hypothetical protein